ncbi:hypothetical protein [Legionella micdadei]|uniref:Uncharacterized protein n=1 Tax=Legionella micdadei TaxID=451 RepID=A0A098GD00_LEGMI|nr:hypothetical protein [Legionella micdadei]ARG98014.1 hypothetical protein B6N58_10275 [Legionella micdadei]ARG99667.1 hypothetical protein B6V88_04125 [Legionella micdadei]KTD26621.1 hypothetical protein Lmic_2715 [Legionella micdadei]NSL19272.1 hypothetical protein [Legionella micdadei]CEG60358.1 protein of unknown function [Legionella micdadei]
MYRLTQQFRESLINFLRDPENPANKTKLAAAAYAIYEEASTLYGSEPDKFMLHVDTRVKPAVKGIRIHPDLGKLLDNFNRELSLSDSVQERLAFHPLTLTYYEYLKKNLLDPEQITRDKLDIIQQTIQQVKAENNPYAKELESAYIKLKTLVDEHFELPQTAQSAHYEHFKRKLEFVCSEHKQAIQSNVRIKTVFYDFLAVISSLLIYIGEYLSNLCQKKVNFFKVSSILPKETLSNFSLGTSTIEITEYDEDEDSDLQSSTNMIYF